MDSDDREASVRISVDGLDDFGWKGGDGIGVGGFDQRRTGST